MSKEVGAGGRLDIFLDSVEVNLGSIHLCLHYVDSKVQERFMFNLEIMEYYSLNASQNSNILSLVSKLPNLGCFC